MIVIGLEHLYICKQTARKNGLFVCFRPKTELIEVEVLARRLASMDLVVIFFFFFITFRGFYASRIKVYRYWFVGWLIKGLLSFEQEQNEALNS